MRLDRGAGGFELRIEFEHLAQPPHPAGPLAGLAIGHARDVVSERVGDRLEDVVIVGERNASEQMNWTQDIPL